MNYHGLYHQRNFWKYFCSMGKANDLLYGFRSN